MECIAMNKHEKMEIQLLLILYNFNQINPKDNIIKVHIAIIILSLKTIIQRFQPERLITMNLVF